jgi:hypothetical protein
MPVAMRTRIDPAGVHRKGKAIEGDAPNGIARAMGVTRRLPRMLRAPGRHVAISVS